MNAKRNVAQILKSVNIGNLTKILDAFMAHLDFALAPTKKTLSSHILEVSRPSIKTEKTYHQ